MKKLNFMKIILFIFLLSVSGFSECISGGYYISVGNIAVPGCNVYPSQMCTSISVSSSIHSSSYYYESCQPGTITYCGNTSKVWNCITNSGDNIPMSNSMGCGGNICPTAPVKAYCTVRCNNSSEADSVACINQGNIWQDGVCKGLCDDYQAECNNKPGKFLGNVLPDTIIENENTTYTKKCYYNCSYKPNSDSSVFLVNGNIILNTPNDSISNGTKHADFNSIRSEIGGIYIYDILDSKATTYVDSITSIQCANHLYRCVKNNKYVYWYDNQTTPDSCTNIVRIK